MYLEGPSANPVPVLNDHPCFQFWDNKIREARARGFFTSEDRRQAFNWDLCYVGNAKDAFGVRYEDEYHGVCGHCPMDANIRLAGCQFFSAVKRDKFDEAEAAAKQIKQLLLSGRK